MYNKEHKNLYLNIIAESGERYVKSVRSLFNNVANIEKEAGIDFYQFDQDNAIASIATISGRKRSTIKWNLTTLKDYLDWCKNNALIDYNVLDGIGYKDIDNNVAIRQETIPNIEYLRRIVEIGLPEINEDVSMNTIYRLYAFLLYAGLTEEEIVTITKQEAVVGSDNILKYNNKEIVLPPFLKQYLDRVIATDEIVWIRGSTTCYTKLVPSNYLIGAVRALDGRLDNFKNIVSKINKLYVKETGKHIRLSTSRIYESGVYYRLLQYELDTGKINETIILTAFNIKPDNYKSDYLFTNQVGNIKYDYTAWKKAWNYQ
jgi:hypothetical protein